MVHIRRGRLRRGDARVVARRRRALRLFGRRVAGLFARIEIGFKVADPKERVIGFFEFVFVDEIDRLNHEPVALGKKDQAEIGSAQGFQRIKDAGAFCGAKGGVSLGDNLIGARRLRGGGGNL